MPETVLGHTRERCQLGSKTFFAPICVMQHWGKLLKALWTEDERSSAFVWTAEAIGAACCVCMKRNLP